MDVMRLDEDMPQTDDNKVAALKKAFLLFTKGDQVRFFKLISLNCSPPINFN